MSKAKSSLLSEQLNKMRGLISILEDQQFEHLQKPYEIFAREHGIDPDELSYLGRGDFGQAFSTNDGRVIKETRSRSEAEIAKSLIGKTNYAFAQIYDVKQYGGLSCILMEEVDTDSNIENLFYQVQELLEQQGLPIQYLDHLDIDEMEISPELQEFIDGISGINRSYRSIGIEASDVRPENLGYNRQGKLVAFDIEDKAKTR